MTRKKQPKKIGTCLDCGLVKNLKYKGLCANCYSRRSYRRKNPLARKICAYQKCSKVFYSANSIQVYCSKKCKIEDNRPKTEYLGWIPKGKCPECHRNNFGILRKLTVSHSGIIVWEKWEIQHVRGCYYKGRERTTKREYLGAYYFDSLPIIL